MAPSWAQKAASLALAATLSLGAMVAPPQVCCRLRLCVLGGFVHNQATHLTHTTTQVVPPAHAGLTAGDPVKNARALLRNALPVNNKPIRQIQLELEGISEQLRVPGSKPLGAIERVGAFRFYCEWLLLWLICWVLCD